MTEPNAPSATESPVGPNELTALDWIAVSLTLLIVTFLASSPFLITPAFMAMFQDFGSKEDLPFLTRLVTRVWFPLALALVPLGLTSAGSFLRLSLGWRRSLIVFAFLLGLAAVALYLMGMYAPVYALAEAVSKE